MEKFKNKFRIASTRLPCWDYGWNAAYFVTICTAHRVFYFGEVMDGFMALSDIGCLAWKYWNEISAHFPFVQLDAFIVMPNHVHGILVINKTDDAINGNYNRDSVETGHCPVSTVDDQLFSQKWFRNQGKNTLSSIIGSYKSVVSKHAHKIDPEFAWQARFYDHIIRDEKSYDTIADYIFDNPRRWHEDKYFA